MLWLELRLGISPVLLVSCYSAVALPGRYAAHAQYTVSMCGRGQTQRSNGSSMDEGDASTSALVKLPRTRAIIVHVLIVHRM